MRMHQTPAPLSHYSATQGPAVYVQQGPTPHASFRAGVIFTAVLAVGIIILLATVGIHDQSTGDVQKVSAVAGIALLPGVALMGWVFVPVIVILSIITMCRGGIFRGILLLLGAPLAMVLAVALGATVIVNAHQGAKPAPVTRTAAREERMRFAPPALAGATTPQEVKSIRDEARARVLELAGLTQSRRSALLQEIDSSCDARLAQLPPLGRKPVQHLP